MSTGNGHMNTLQWMLLVMLILWVARAQHPVVPGRSAGPPVGGVRPGLILNFGVDMSYLYRRRRIFIFLPVAVATLSVSAPIIWGDPHLLNADGNT